MQIERNDRETTVVEAMLKVPCAGELLGAAVGLVRAADSNSRTDEGTFALLIKAFFTAETVCRGGLFGGYGRRNRGGDDAGRIAEVKTSRGC